MSWTQTQLAAAFNALSPVPATLSAGCVTLNAQTTSQTVNIAWPAIRDVLMNDFDWGALTQVAETPVGGTLPAGAVQTVAIQAAAMALRECCIYGGTFAASNTTDWNKLVAAANLLTPANVGAISSASASAVVALRTAVVPTWSPPVQVAQLQSAQAAGLISNSIPVT